MADPHKLNLAALLSDRLFFIPEYQRPYSWKKKQRDDLFNDIEKACKSKSNHFMATIVALKRKDVVTVRAKEFSKVDIVDGQQRITTLVILLKEISSFLCMKKGNDLKETGEELKKELVKSDGNVIVLQTNHDTAHMLTSYLSDKPAWNKEPKTVAERNLKDAINECREIVKQWGGNNCLNYLTVIKNRLDFIYFEIEDEATVYTTFEVLNSRGQSVEWLDKTKSMLMGLIYEKYPKAYDTKFTQSHEIWTRLYEILGEKDISSKDVLCYSATLLGQEGSVPTRILSEENAYDLFCSMGRANPDEILNYMDFMLQIATEISEFYRKYPYKVLTKITHARLLYLAIQKSPIKPNDKTTLIECWEKITFLIFGICRGDSRNAVGEFVRLAYNIFHNEDGFSSWNKEFKRIANLPKYEMTRNLEDLLKEKNCYEDWHDELRYLLFEYEKDLAKNQKTNLNDNIWKQIFSQSAADSIEHIFPQTPTSSWTGKMGKGKNCIQNNIHRLGNLTLLTSALNSEAGNESFKEKKKVYKKANLLQLNEIKNKKDWTIKEIEERESVLKQFIIERFKL